MSVAAIPANIVTRSIDLIHYGSTRFRPERFEPISDCHRNKPCGGLWTSPVESAYGWKQWCEAEHFKPASLRQSFRVRFTGTVFVIDSVADLGELPWIEPMSGWHFPLWQALQACGIDAVHLTERGERLTRFSKPRSLYGWDCETVLVFNPQCLHEIGKEATQ